MPPLHYVPDVYFLNYYFIFFYANFFPFLSSSKKRPDRRLYKSDGTGRDGQILEL